ncbi:MAG TPA: hypothetical protein VOA87_19765 [Thermoanaerobaculia bacterium]|nr:hypothetical protein [Thermoanaerobaculia bacterium]
MAMELAEALKVTLAVARALDDLGIPYYLGGSLASSLHGIPQSAQDAELVADLKPEHLKRLSAALSATFYIDRGKAAAAVRRRTSFRLLHLQTFHEVELHVLRDDPLPHQAMARRQRLALPGIEVAVASPEDVILQKLHGLRLGDEISSLAWEDVQGILKVQRSGVDLHYLGQRAKEMRLEGLLQRALDEAGAARWLRPAQ